MTLIAVAAERSTPNRRSTDPDPHAVPRLRLLSSFACLRGGESIELPLNVQRLVIFLSLQAHPLHRAHVAGTLWPETSDHRASGNLRSALWRLNQLGCELVHARGSTLRLDSHVRVDLHESSAQARQVLMDDESDLDELEDSLFFSDLLPDRYEDWLMSERDRFHELRLRALERICERLTARGAYARAIEAGLMAVAGDPLRESAQRALVKVHLAEGNVAGGIRQFQLYRSILREELGLEPSPQFMELVDF